MKKIIALVLSLVMLLSMCLTAGAVPAPMGMDNAAKKVLVYPTDTNIKPYADYADYYLPELGKPDFKPQAQFGISIDGQEVSSPVEGNLDAPTPSISLNPANSSIAINNYSNPYSGRVLTQYDFQYRIVPEGASRDKQPIKANYLNNWTQVQAEFNKAIEELKQVPTLAEMEVYLCVADGKNKSDNLYNWSDNGNVAIGKTDVSFPDGIIWYFSGMVIEWEPNAENNLKMLSATPSYDNDNLNISSNYSYTGNGLDKTEIQLNWNTEDGEAGEDKQIITDIATGENSFDFDVFVPKNEDKDVKVNYTITINPSKTMPKDEITYDDNTITGNFTIPKIKAECSIRLKLATF
jgi:hypothetical protein